MRSIPNILTVSVQFLYEIFCAGLSSPVGMVASVFDKGFMFLSPFFAPGTRLRSIPNILTVSVQFLYEIFCAGLSSPAGMVASVFDKGFKFLSPFFAPGTRLKSIIVMLTVSVQFLYEIFCAGLSSPAGMVASVFDKGFMYMLLFFTTMKKIVPQFNSTGSWGQGPPSDPRPPGSKKIPKTQILSLKRNIPAPPPKPPVMKATVVKTPVVKAPVVSARPPPIQQSRSEAPSRQDASPVMLLTFPTYGTSSGSTGALPLSRKILRNMWRTACLCMAVLILAPRNDFTFQSIGNIRLLILESNTYKVLLSNARNAQAAALRFYHTKIQGPARPDVATPASKEPSLPVTVRRHISELSNGCPFLKKL